MDNDVKPSFQRGLLIGSILFFILFLINYIVGYDISGLPVLIIIIAALFCRLRGDSIEKETRYFCYGLLASILSLVVISTAITVGILYTLLSP